MIEDVISELNAIPNDKLLHSFYGTLIFAVQLFFVSHITAFFVVFTLAVLKEVYDYFMPNHTPDIFDIVATVGIPLILTLGQITW